VYLFDLILTLRALIAAAIVWFVYEEVVVALLKKEDDDLMDVPLSVHQLSAFGSRSGGVTYNLS